MRVLVAGGAGYIGSHVCKALAEAGVEPVTLDNLSEGNRRAVKWGPLIVGDVADPRLAAAAIERTGAQAVIHLAGSAPGPDRPENPAACYRSNVAGTLSLIEAMHKTGLKAIVFSSTAAVYGHPRRLPIPEDCPAAPIDPFGRSKLMIEQILADEAAAYNLRFVALRYFNAAGADPEGEIGDRRRAVTHFIAAALSVAAGESARLAIEGLDHATADGSCVRDYIHVSDLAAGHLLALGHLRKGGASAVLNLGTGRGASMLEIVAGVERVTGRKLACLSRPRRLGDPPALVADPSLANRLLGFAPKLSDVDSIVGTAWQFRQRRQAA